MKTEEQTSNELHKQTQKIQLVMQMAQAAYDADKLATMIDEHQEEIDYQFLVLVTTTIQQASEMHDEATVDRYGRVRETIVKQLDLKAEEVPSLGAEPNMDELLTMLLNTPAINLQAVVAANRPLLDYNFFMHLTQQATGSKDLAEKQKLLSLRQRLVTLTEEMDRMAQEAMERASHQLHEILNAQDLAAKIDELAEGLDEAFLVVLSANLEQARKQKQEEIAALLMRIYAKVVQTMESRLRPELRAMNDLLRMDSSEARRTRIRQEMQIYNPAGFIEMIEVIGGDLEASGQANAELLERLYTIADEAREVAATVDVSFTPTEALFGQ